MPSENHTLPPRTAAEFQRTAQLIRRAPWKLNRGAEYLDMLSMGVNASAEPPTVQGVFSLNTIIMDTQLLQPDIPEIFAPQQPRCLVHCVMLLLHIDCVKKFMTVLHPGL